MEQHDWLKNMEKKLCKKHATSGHMKNLCWKTWLCEEHEKTVMYEQNGVDNMEKLDFIKPDRVEKLKTKI